MRPTAHAPACCALALILTACATRSAAQTQPWNRYADEVDATITRLVAEIELFRFTDEHLAIIKSLAHQEGVEVVCPGFKTDSGKRVDFLSQIVPMRDEDVRTAPLADVVLRSEVMFAFGTHFGATVALGKVDPAAFCAKAELEREDPALVARIWLEGK
jgi:hypothetical protein